MGSQNEDKGPIDFTAVDKTRKLQLDRCESGYRGMYKRSDHLRAAFSNLRKMYRYESLVFSLPTVARTGHMAMGTS